MKRSGPLKRTTPLKANTPLKRTGPIKTRRKHEPELQKARQAVFARSAGRCEARWDGCTGVAQHAHHRLRRSQGGKHTPENLLAVCSWCHERGIHGNVDFAKRHGWLVEGWENPATVKVITGCGPGCEVDHRE